MAKGFAAVDGNHNILVATVGRTSTEAMANWLRAVCGFTVPQGMGEFSIRDNFNERAVKTGVKIVLVDVTFGD